ncbi:hypothetical protein [Saccharothrix syringae]|uniref:Uncharacterized protein n=1 Tax=Saccharothrix syringae TaxID=103733 RepID=A0A5Q0H4Z3_SACSY|nr:hypothetical protein [Saccharothrix syringae]QFZ21321.1 hypothetical protein EKG83_31540 [Saccharothrix syringae]
MDTAFCEGGSSGSRLSWAEEIREHTGWRPPADAPRAPPESALFQPFGPRTGAVGSAPATWVRGRSEFEYSITDVTDNTRQQGKMRCNGPRLVWTTPDGVTCALSSYLPEQTVIALANTP